MAIARQLKGRREAGGAVQLEGTEVKVELNEEQEIENLVPKQVCFFHLHFIQNCNVFLSLV